MPKLCDRLRLRGPETIRNLKVLRIAATHLLLSASWREAQMAQAAHFRPAGVQLLPPL